jgi:hypothetical protein
LQKVAERALFLWNNENLVNAGCLSRQHAAVILPLIYGPLYKNSTDHWNATVEGTHHLIDVLIDVEVRVAQALATHAPILFKLTLTDHSTLPLTFYRSPVYV